MEPLKRKTDSTKEAKRPKRVKTIDEFKPLPKPRNLAVFPFFFFFSFFLFIKPYLFTRINLSFIVYASTNFCCTFRSIVTCSLTHTDLFAAVSS